MNSSININDFDKICRICLVSKEKMLPVSTPQVVCMLEDCPSVEESYKAKMPQQICDNCFWQLKNAYYFRQQCVLSSEILCTILRQEESNDNKCKLSVEENLNGTRSSLVQDEKESEIMNIKNEELELSCSEDKTVIEENQEKKYKIECDEEDYSENVTQRRSKRNKMERKTIDCNELKDESADENTYLSEEFSYDATENDYTSEDNEPQEHGEQKHRSVADILIQKYKIYDLTCNICKKEISTKSTLLRHMETHDKNRPLKYQCNICNKGFYTSENLKKHVNRHLGKTKFSCDRCPKRFYVLSALGVHYKSCHKVKAIQCPKCPAQMYHPLQVEQHEETHGEKQYVCDECGKVFPKKNRLTKHKKYHSDERPYSCDMCGRGFKTKSDLTSHVKLRHVESDRREICYICGKLIPVGTLTIHLDTHKDRSVKCPECDKIFASKIILDRHINHIHKNGGISQKYYCNICQKALGSKGSLKTHMVTTHSDDKNNECHICGKTYKLLSHVRAHIQSVHMDVRPHICQTCNKAFHTKLLLKNHMRTHTGERPFPCSICGKAFGFKNVLNTHMKVHSK